MSGWLLMSYSNASLFHTALKKVQVSHNSGLVAANYTSVMYYALQAV